MYSIIEVAQIIIHINKGINHIKMQVLLCLLALEFSKDTHTLLFSEPILAVNFGGFNQVIRDIYFRFGSSPLPVEMRYHRNITSYTEEGQYIMAFMKKYQNVELIELVEIIKKDIRWKRAYLNKLDGYNNEIDLLQMN